MHDKRVQANSELSYALENTTWVLSNGSWNPSVLEDNCSQIQFPHSSLYSPSVRRLLAPQGNGLPV